MCDEQRRDPTPPAHAGREPVLAPGAVLNLAEDDYRFGIGTLTLRITEVLHVQRLDDGPWVSVRGLAIRWDGRDGDERQILVRVSAIGRSLRRKR